MNKTRALYIVRHAKSVWEYDNVHDVDRPLTEKGILNAYEVSTQIKNDGILPALFISSNANRAMHTSFIFAKVISYPYERIIISSLLYESTTAEIIKLIKTTDDQVLSLMIFGHNPVFTYLVNNFGNKTIDNLPTSGAVGLTFSAGSWKDIDKSSLIAQTNYFPVKKK